MVGEEVVDGRLRRYYRLTPAGALPILLTAAAVVIVVMIIRNRPRER